jgi:ABC-type polysaccharide/polyol phosphate transport system ATPase subunit
MQMLNRGRKQYYREFWALKGVSFSVGRGETIGIIGRNGSGKSTLLQIICGILSPSSGTVQTYGRVAALLELGSGFNSEFTGRENIYLSGTLLGLSQSDIEERFDSIASFADIGDFIDQPVKTYSSGMFVRLAFAIQTAIDPELLIVDEALAVGDVAFIAKCMRRMHQLVQAGTTILFVSHDISSVRQFCSRAIWLHGGQVQRISDAASVTAEYLEFTLGGTQRSQVSQCENRNNSFSEEHHKGDTSQSVSCADNHFSKSLRKQDSDLIRWGGGGVSFIAVDLSGLAVKGSGLLEFGEQITIKIEAKIEMDLNEGLYGFGYSFRTPKGLDVIGETSIDNGIILPECKEGDVLQLNFELNNIVAPGDYFLTLQSETRKNGLPEYFDFIENALQFKVTSNRTVYFLALPSTIIEFNRIKQ